MHLLNVSSVIAVLQAIKNESTVYGFKIVFQVRKSLRRAGKWRNFQKMMKKMILMTLRQKSSHRNSIKKILILTTQLLLLHSSRLPHNLFLLLRYKHLPCQDHHLLDHHLLHLYGLLGHLQAFLLGHLQVSTYMRLLSICYK
jgi:hypothetical protein